MTQATKITWMGIILLIAAIALSSLLVSVHSPLINQSDYSLHAGELVRDTLFGQTFVAEDDNLSGVAVMFATYSNRANTEPIRFHLRSSIHDPQDIRTVTVHPQDLGDNQFYRFAFDPIPDSKGKEYFFFVVSPTATSGNAVTVAISNNDPYHFGTAYIVRGQGSAVTDPAVLELSGRQAIDLTFQAYHRVPLRTAFIRGVQDHVRMFIETWDERRSHVLVWLQAAAPIALFFLILSLLRKSTYQKAVRRFGSKKRFTFLLLLILFAAGFGLRYLYAESLPVTNDEGAYMYDAWVLREGVLAGGDAYVKSPLAIAWISVWQHFLGNTIIAGRLSSIAIGSLMILPLYFLAKDLWSSRAVTKIWMGKSILRLPDPTEPEEMYWGRRIGIAVAAIWALFGAGIVFTVYAHTQPLALFFGVSGLSILLMALRGTTPRLTFFSTKQEPSVFGWFVLAGALFGLGVVSRKSTVVLGLLPLLLVITEGRTWKLRLQHIGALAIGFFAVIAAFLAGSYYIYGMAGVQEALGLHSIQDGTAEIDEMEATLSRIYSIRGMIPFFRESLPLIFLSLLGLGAIAEQTLRMLVGLIKGERSKMSIVLLDHILPKIGWLPVWLLFWWQWNFFFRYEGSMFMRYGVEWLWYFFAFGLAVFTFWPRSEVEKVIWQKKQPLLRSLQPNMKIVPMYKHGSSAQNDEDKMVWRHITALAAIPLWIGALVFFYVNWIKFHPNYISEFIPPLVVLSGFGIVAMYMRTYGGEDFVKRYPYVEAFRRIMLVGVTAGIAWAAVVSNYITYSFEHTGTFDQSAIEEAAQWARLHIPPEERVFTAAAIVPYLSGHRISRDIAHPSWYGYDFTRNNPDRLQVFLPSVEEMQQAYLETDWFILEGHTRTSYLEPYPGIEADLRDNWRIMAEIPNGVNTITFYQRIR